MTKTITTYEEWRALRRQITTQVGFIPTMGALHAGHASLFTRARAECEITVASIFVNPTQFNNPDDLAKYPKTLEHDLEILNQTKIDYVLLPRYEELYADQYNYRVSEQSLSLLMEGAHRPGHFDGVLTVVLKLFNWVRPNRAYFGEKDYQQYLLIKKMADAFFLDIEVICGQTIREESGLAMSSRNVRLDADQRATLAPQLHHYLRSAKTANDAKSALLRSGFEVEYVTDLFARRFAAATLGAVRLIDNISLDECL